MARKCSYSDAIATAICERLAEGESLRSICADPSMPNKSTVLRWLADGSKAAFSYQYARAHEIQADALFDDMLEIADDARNDWIAQDGPEGTSFRLNTENIQRSRLRLDARKWMASKLAPKKYSKRGAVDAELAGAMQVTVVTGVERRIVPG